MLDGLALASTLDEAFFCWKKFPTRGFFGGGFFFSFSFFSAGAFWTCFPPLLMACHPAFGPCPCPCPCRKAEKSLKHLDIG